MHLQVLPLSFKPVADPEFPVGGVPTHWGVPTSNMGTFWQNVCENERIGPLLGVPAVHPPMDLSM